MPHGAKWEGLGRGQSHSCPRHETGAHHTPARGHDLTRESRVVRKSFQIGPHYFKSTASEEENF